MYIVHQELELQYVDFINQFIYLFVQGIWIWSEAQNICILYVEQLHGGWYYLCLVLSVLSYNGTTVTKQMF